MANEIRKRSNQAASLGELQSVLRDVMVRGTTRDDLEDIWDSLLDMAKGQNQWAIQVVFERILGKAAVGQAATIADSAMSAQVTKRIEEMTEEELQTAVALSMKIHGDQGALPHHPKETDDDAIDVSADWRPGQAGVRQADGLPQPRGEEEEA